MARRTRKFIFDNTTGTVYSNIDNPALAVKSNIAAGVVPKIIKVSVARAGKPVAKVVSTKSLMQKKNVVFTNIFMQVTDSVGKEAPIAAPVGGNLTVRLRKVSANGTSTTLGDYSIENNATSSTNSINFTIADNESVFADVIDIGTIRSGLGLNIILTYFG